MNFNNFFLSDFLSQNVVIPPIPKVPHEAKCANTPKLYTTDNNSDLSICFVMCATEL